MGGRRAPASTLDCLNLPQQEQHSGSRTAQHSDDDNGDSSVTTTSAPDARLAHPLLHPHSSRPLSLPRQHLRLPPHGSQCTTPPSAASYHANSSTAPSLAPTTGLPRDFVIALNSRMFKLHTASRRLKATLTCDWMVEDGTGSHRDAGSVCVRRDPSDRVRCARGGPARYLRHAALPYAPGDSQYIVRPFVTALGRALTRERA